MKNNLSYLLFCSLFLGCTTNNLHISKEEKTPTVQISNLTSYDIYQTNGLVKSGNTIITVSPTNNYNAIAVNLKTAQRNRFFRRRLAENDNMFQVMSLNSQDGHSVTALDFRKGRIIETPISTSPSRTASSNQERIIQLPAGQQHLIAVKTSTFVIATGLYTEGRYLYYSLTDQSARYFLSYPDHSTYPNLRETTKAMLYASNVLRIRPDESAFVCADMYSGVIDFCRIISGSIERVKMLRLHYPHVDITETPTVNVEYYRDNQLGFTDIAVSQDYVYALYSGNSYKELGSQASMGQTLFVYDWEGNLLKSYYLDMPLTNICYDATEEAIYGTTNKQETSLIKINI